MIYTLTKHTAPLPAVELLAATDRPRYYWELATSAWRVQMSSNHELPEPVVYTVIEGTLWLGVEQGIFALDAGTGRPRLRVTDTSYLRNFQETSQGTVLAVSEDELLHFAPGGELLWRQTFPDVIDTVDEAATGTLVVTTTGGDSFEVRLSTGRAL